jgi:hypothetical protein
MEDAPLAWEVPGTTICFAAGARRLRNASTLTLLRSSVLIARRELATRLVPSLEIARPAALEAPVAGVMTSASKAT